MIEKIKLHNWKSHKETELQFGRGINVLVGPMGAGKSSVLQGICFALFGSVPEVKRREVKVAELVNRGSGPPAQIDLQVSSGGKRFSIHRLIKAKNTEASVRDSDGILLAGTNPSQATAFLKNVLRLDEDTFLRTVYAKQNEIDLFLQLGPQERKTRLDELMGVHKFEAARKSAVRLANQLQARRDELEKLAESFEMEKLKEQADNLQKEVSELEEEKEKQSRKVQELEKEKAEAELKLRELKAKFEAFARFEERQRILVSQLNELKLKLREPVQSQSELKVKLEEVSSKIAALDESRAELSRKREVLGKDLMSLERQCGVCESRLADTEMALQKIETLKIELQQLTKSLGAPEEEAKRLESEIKELDKEIAGTAREISLLKKHFEELKSAEGFCPTCSRALEREAKEKLVAEKEQKIFKLADVLRGMRAQKADLEAKKDEVQDLLEQSRAFGREIAKEPELLKQREALKSSFQKLRQDLEKARSDDERCKKELASAEQELSSLAKTESGLKEQLALAELKEQKERLEAQLSEVRARLAGKPDESVLAKADASFRQKLRECEEVTAKIKSADFVIEEKNKRLSELRRQQERAEQVLAQTAELTRKLEFIQQFKNALLVAQEQLRRELITLVNEVMASLWHELYPYESWGSVRLSASETDYTLQLRDAQGEWVNVAGFASGGERMIASLVLRLAFAKVLSPEFSVLILDEPTHNLDEAAISSFMLALQERLPKFLEQLFLVTHEERLAEIGDTVIRLGQRSR